MVEVGPAPAATIAAATLHHDVHAAILRHSIDPATKGIHQTAGGHVHGTAAGCASDAVPAKRHIAERAIDPDRVKWTETSLRLTETSWAPILRPPISVS